MTTVIIIASLVGMYFTWKCGYSFGYWDGYGQGQYDEQLSRFTEKTEVTEKPEIKSYQLN